MVPISLIVPTDSQKTWGLCFSACGSSSLTEAGLRMMRNSLLLVEIHQEFELLLLCVVHVLLCLLMYKFGLHPRTV